MNSNRVHHGSRRRPLPQFFDHGLNGSTVTVATEAWPTWVAMTTTRHPLTRLEASTTHTRMTRTMYLGVEGQHRGAQHEG
jgi:hypothetical protein